MKQSQAGRGILCGALVAFAVAANVDGLIAAQASVPADQPEYRAMEMALIPAGSFQMGDSFGDGYSDELPVNTVAVSAFIMDRCEITKALWDEVATWAAANGYDIGPGSAQGKAADHPVWSVSWYEAVKWANARSEKEGLGPCYTVDGTVYRTGQSDNPTCNWSASGYRLPTEAEWEKAARGGGERSRFPWNSTNEIQHALANYHSTTDYVYDTSATRGYHPDYSSEPVPYISPVGNFAPNGYRLYDMGGDVMEWCWDWYDDSYYTVSPDEDPRGPAVGMYRTRRGGSWFSLAFYCRVARRDYNSPYIEKPTLGFRLVRTAPRLCRLNGSWHGSAGGVVGWERAGKRSAPACAASQLVCDVWLRCAQGAGALRRSSGG